MNDDIDLATLYRARAAELVMKADSATSEAVMGVFLTMALSYGELAQRAQSVQ